MWVCWHNGWTESGRPRDLKRLENVIFEKSAGPRGHAVVRKQLVGKSAHVILKELGITAGPEVRALFVEVPNDHPLVWTEQMMPVLPVTRVRNVNEAIELAVACEGGNFHTACMHSHDLAALPKTARRCNCSIFVKNGCGVEGLAYRGEGPTSFTIRVADGRRDNHAGIVFPGAPLYDKGPFPDSMT